MLAATAHIAGAVPLSEQAGVTLRPLRASDARLLRAWWDKTASYDSRYRKNPVMRWIDNPSKAAFRCVIMVGGKPQGYCGWDDHNEVQLYVTPKYRGKGIGTKAMRLMMGEAGVRNKKQLVVITRRPDFWIRIGFKERTSWLLKDIDRSQGRISLIWGQWGPNNGIA